MDPAITPSRGGTIWCVRSFFDDGGFESLFARLVAIPFASQEEAAIRPITDARPTYGDRRVTALLNRARHNSGEAFHVVHEV